jgi:putative lipoic acid-binding regulatory protein
MTQDSFKEKLEECHEFPGFYLFKFIVPRERSGELLEMFAGCEPSRRESRTGKYIGFTVSTWMESSEQVVSVYKAAGNIQGLIAL